MEPRDAAVSEGLRARASHALRQRHNWTQLAKFCVVGVSGYAVNLAVYAALLNVADLHYRLAATCSFVVAVIAYAGNLVILSVLVEVGLGKIVSQAIAIVLVTPANFIGNKLWSFRRRH